jgi:quinol monooxygenase YgiN
LPNLIIVSITVKKGSVDDAVSILKIIVDKMQEADGCLSAQLVEDVIHPEKFKIYEKWNSLEKQKDFVAYLQSEGLFAKLKDTLNEGPSSESYSTTT